MSETNAVEENGSSGTRLFGLGPLPPEWKVKRIPEVADVTMGSSPPSSTYNQEGEGLPFFQGNADFGLISPAVTTWCDQPAKTAEKGEILMSVRAPVGDLNIAPDRCCIGRGVAGLHPNDMNGRYLFYSLVKRRRWLSRLAAGSTFKSVSSGDIEKFEVPVPPLEEQRKIASVLYTVDELIEKSEQIKSRLQRLEKGIRRWLLRHGLRNEDQKEVRVQSQSIRVPQSWGMVPLADIARNGPESFTDGDWVESDDMVEDGPIQLIQLKHIGEGQFKGECDRFVSEEFFREEGCTEVEEGDLLISRMAEPILRTIRVPEFEKRSITAVDVVVAKVDETEWEPDYVRAVLNTKTWQDIARAFASGSTRLRISRSNMEKIEIPKPPLEEQREIAMLLGQIEGALGREEQYMSCLERVKDGLMQDLLTGEVRTKDVDIEVPEEVAAYG